jgi:hypothetical protein
LLEFEVKTPTNYVRVAVVFDASSNCVATKIVCSSRITGEIPDLYIPTPDCSECGTTPMLASYPSTQRFQPFQETTNCKVIDTWSEGKHGGDISEDLQTTMVRHAEEECALKRRRHVKDEYFCSNTGRINYDRM